MGFKSTSRRAAGVGAAAAAVCAMLIAPSSATAAPAPQGEVGAAAVYYIRHVDLPHNCLTETAEHEVFLLECDNSVDQQWDNYTPGRFRNVNSKLCLASNGSKVFTMKCGTPSSTWTTAPTSPKLIRHGVETGKCLTTNTGETWRYGFLVDCGQATRWYTLD